MIQSGKSKEMEAEWFLRFGIHVIRNSNEEG